MFSVGTGLDWFYIKWFYLFYICRLFSKWTYHWTLVNGGGISDFQKVINKNEAEKNKPKITFKVVPPPPPKPKPEPPPPPTPSRRAESPKPLLPRKVEVDVFRIYWKESWKSLKPPKYLYLKIKEPKARIVTFTAIELPSNRKYKPRGYGWDTERTFCPYNWSQSWKQVE